MAHSRLTTAAFRLVSIIFFSLSLFLHTQAQTPTAPSIAKVEPPTWWAAHTVNPVRLLVRGANLCGARVTPTRAGTETSGVLVNSACTYLFVNVSIDPAAAPGDYALMLATAAGRTTIPFRLEAPLDPQRNFQGITTDDVIYLIMPDRVANGDPGNDAPAGSPAAANDRRNARAYHGGDLRGVINHLPYLKDLGITALWLTPWYDNWNGVNICDKPWCPSTDYHGYGAIDYYGVEDHFGDLQTLRELVAQAHALGLKVVQDQVANHTGPRHPWVAAPPLDDWFHGTAAQHVSNAFQAETLLSPHASVAARRPTLDGWFGNTLPDMNQDEPEVARYEIQNALWWIGATGLDAIRQDTIQYMPRPFIRDLSHALHRQYPRLWMVGEVFDRDPIHTSFFIAGRKGWDGIDTELDSVFDFPLWQVSLDAFAGKAPLSTLRHTLRADALYPDAARLTTMISNHDVPRTVGLPGMTIEGAMLHTAFLLSVRGTPQLYYGDEIALAGGDDPDNRRDFPGGWRDDARDAFTAQGRDEPQQRMFAWTRDWLRLRREHASIRRGELIDLQADDDTYAFARRDADETLIIAFNRAAMPKRINAPASYLGLPDGARLVPLLVAKEEMNVAAGVLEFTVPARSAVAYKLEAAPAR